ncbi:MAG: GntR family transcriptional regulator [Lachnospiraceae bacterium]|nr:GntR family transcriptional regulator [Lachnospiraceae bacterium]
MPSAKYDKIYDVLKKKIEKGVYRVNTYLPSEYTLVGEYDCSRNTVRRAISQLGEEGYVQSMHGKGVIVIYDPLTRKDSKLEKNENLREMALRDEIPFETTVLDFQNVEIDDEVAAGTGFVSGEQCISVLRVRKLNGEAVSLERSLFKASAVRGLTREIAEESVYSYIEEKLGDSIRTIQQKIEIKLADEEDRKYLDMQGYNCLASIRSRAYNSAGDLFEFTEAHRRPDYFVIFRQIKKRDRYKSSVPVRMKGK